MNTNRTFDAVPTGSMPISMAVDSKHVTAKTAAAPGQKKDLEYFARKVTKAIIVQYRSTKALADVFIEARMALSPEDFQQLVKESQISYSFFCKLMKQASDFKLNDPANEPFLPEAFSSRHEIMLMKESTFRIGVQKGIIHPNCTLADLKKLREQLETPKRKKASATAKARSTVTTAATTAETPKATPAPAKAEEPTPHAKEAAVRAPVNSPGLRVVGQASGETGTAAAMAPAPAQGYIKIVLPKEVADQHEQDLVRIVDEIQAVVKRYEFICGVRLEVAA